MENATGGIETIPPVAFAGDYGWLEWCLIPAAASAAASACATTATGTAAATCAAAPASAQAAAATGAAAGLTRTRTPGGGPVRTRPTTCLAAPPDRTRLGTRAHVACGTACRDKKPEQTACNERFQSILHNLTSCCFIRRCRISRARMPANFHGDDNLKTTRVCALKIVAIASTGSAGRQNGSAVC
jgi:hypothetical protein